MSDVGGAARRDWGWWSHQPMRSVNPWSVRLVDERGADPEIVRQYRENPGQASADGNDPCVVALENGGLLAREGRHRVLAARAEGRPVRVRITSEAQEQGAER